MDGVMDGKLGKSDEKIVLAVVFGGQSSEHEVSRVSAQSVLENVDRDKYDVRMIGITKQGEWLRYDGDLSLLGSGEWEPIARERRRRLNAGDRAVSGNEGADSSVRGEVSGSVSGEASYSVRGDVSGTRENASSCLSLLSSGNEDAAEKPVDVVFPVLHGPNGEDGSIQGVFQLAGVPYVGCGILASAAGMDKTFSKIVFSQAGIPQARFVIVFRSEINGGMDVIGRKIEETLGFPCFVKPANAGSSVGVSKVKTPDALESALREAGKYDSKILVEEFIDGREVECAILGNEEPMASVVGEVIPCNEFYDYTAKYIDARSETRIPAELDADVAEEVRRQAIKAFKALGASGLSRVDFFVEHGTNRVVLNEINTLPGFTSISMYAKLWAASGIPYPELVDRLVELALRRHSETGFSIERSAVSTDSPDGKDTMC